MINEPHRFCGNKGAAILTVQQTDRPAIILLGALALEGHQFQKCRVVLMTQEFLLRVCKPVQVFKRQVNTTPLRVFTHIPHNIRQLKRDTQINGVVARLR